MRRLFTGLALVLVTAAAAPWTTAARIHAQAAAPRDVTFAKDLAPIVYANCAYCHRPGEIAPFSLLTYKDARPWARSMKQQVQQKTMPPWNAHPGYGSFQNPRVLTEKEIAL